MPERAPIAPGALAMNLPCPVCRQAMTPRVLACDACAVRVEGSFNANEFAGLEDDYLQLLRVFVVCEGRIRDMEKALGISYPTVKTRLAALRNRLGLHHAPRDDDRADADTRPAPSPSAAPGVVAIEAPGAMAVLDLLSSGAIDHAEAVRRLRDE